MPSENKQSAVWAMAGFVCMVIAAYIPFEGQLADKAVFLCGGIFLLGMAWRKAVNAGSKNEVQHLFYFRRKKRARGC